MARISCSRTSNEMSVSAFTPPNDERDPFEFEHHVADAAASRRRDDRTPRRRIRPCRTARAGGQAACGKRTEGLRVADLEIRLDAGRGGRPRTSPRSRCAATCGPPYRASTSTRVFLGDEAAPDLARACQLVVVGVEFLVQDQEAAQLRAGQGRVLPTARDSLLPRTSWISR